MSRGRGHPLLSLSRGLCLRGAAAASIFLAGCNLQVNRWLRFSTTTDDTASRVGTGTYQRDTFGMLHINAANYGALGCGVGLSQVDDYGLELQFVWELYSPRPSATFDERVYGYILPGQISQTFLQFDDNGFPKPQRLRSATPSLRDLERSHHYVGFHRWVSETLARIQSGQSGYLKDYLEGFTACANRRFAERATEFLTSTDPRIQYLVSRGLHTRQVTMRDPIAGGARSMAEYSMALYQIWASYIDAIPPINQQARLTGGMLEPPRFTASNELGVSGRALASGRSAVMLDPHLPIGGPWDQRKMPVHLLIPGQFETDAALAFGTAWPTIGHAKHLTTGTAVAFAGTSNAHTPTSCWYAVTTPDLATYSSNLTPNGGLAPFATEVIDGMTVKSGTHGRLIGYKADRGLGFMMRIGGDGNHTMIETLWALFHAKTPDEFRAGLDLKQLPYWHIIAGFAGGGTPSRILYLSNQVSAVRDPNPDGNIETQSDWNSFVPADDARYNWSSRLHSASELPQRELSGTSGEPLYLHCHNCTADIHDTTALTRPYLLGGFSRWTNYRQKIGSIVYADAISDGRQLALEDLVPLANHKRDLNLEEIVSKVDATFQLYENTLPSVTRAAASQELARWKAGPVLGTPDNLRVARILYWQYLMQSSGVAMTGIDLSRLILGYIGPGEDVLFVPNAPMTAVDAGIALDKLAQVHLTFGSLFGGDDQSWSQVQLFRTQFGALSLSSTPHALMSIGGFFTHDQNLGRTILDAVGGQNFVLLSEVGHRSLVRTSLHGTARNTAPYASALSILYAAEQFIPMGMGQPVLTPSMTFSTERFQYSPMD